MKKSIKVSILVDNPNSWFHSYLNRLFRIIRKYDSDFSFVRSAANLKKRDVLFALSCDRVLTKEHLSLHKHNIVVHASDLPRDRGWSPWTWKVESGRNTIPITLFEAALECDAGDYYLKDSLKLKGTELVDEIRSKLAVKILSMIEEYLSRYPMPAHPQKGRATYNRRRMPKDSQLSATKSIKQQFNKMRVADNERYPLFFKIKGKQYILKIFLGENK